MHNESFIAILWNIVKMANTCSDQYKHIKKAKKKKAHFIVTCRQENKFLGTCSIPDDS